ncbi:hypothetical protein E0K89_007315 [Aquicoccus sp. SCR17]|nr:hypothetical protein [Carideicomes alvinocaridis]
MRTAPAIVCLTLAALTAACAEFPELDAAVPRSVTRGPYPRLLPMEELLAGPAPRESEESLEAFEARVAALRARAERLRRRDPEAG